MDSAPHPSPPRPWAPSLLGVALFLLLAQFAVPAFAGGLRLVGRMPSPPIRESSGLAASGRFPGVLWTHNDSGGEPRLYPVRRDGTLLSPTGVLVKGAKNVDWEDLARDDRGNLWVGDIGNNSGKRSSFELYVLPEPRPDDAEVSARTLRFPYPEGRGFDAEALFWWRGGAWLIAKTWSGKTARTFRVEVGEPGGENRLLPAGEYPFGGPVTAAGASPDGRRVAVLTYWSLWVFEPPEGSASPLAGTARRLAISAAQCEAICFDGDFLLISNEEGELYEVRLQDLERL